MNYIFNYESREICKANGGIKLHTFYAVATSIPAFVYITPASVNDVNALDVLLYEAGGYFIMDRGYIDFERIYIILQHKAFLVIRAKNNFQFKRMYSAKVDKSTCVMCDQIIHPSGFYPSKE